VVTAAVVYTDAASLRVTKDGRGSR